MNEPDEPPEDHEADSLKLALFFTFGVSLESWAEDGILDRELALYNELASPMDQIYLFTYGRHGDLAFQDKLEENVTIVPKRRVRNNLLYSVFCPVIHRRTLSNVDLVKTNQMLGSWTAVLASFLFGATLVVRTGYILSLFYKELGKPIPVRVMAWLTEKVAYKTADIVLTSSPHGYEYVESRYAPSGRHAMLPNYIETDVFRPMDVEPKGDVCYVGRLAVQKNLFALIDALCDSPYSLTIVGDGDLRDDLETYADGRGIEVHFTGRVPNHELPRLLNGHRVFVLPSEFEGMPKSLLEAMSCGMACVGTDVAGTRDVIEHGATGLLCDVDSDSIRDALRTVLTDAELRHRLGKNARQEIQDAYSLESICSRERRLYRSMKGCGD